MAVRRDIEAVLKLKDELSSKIQKSNKELKEINKHLKKAQKELGIIGKNTAFKNLVKSIITAQGATMAFTTAMRGVGRVFRAVEGEIGEMISASSRAAEVQNLFTVSFGEMGDAAEDWAQRTQQAVGVNDTTLKEMSGTLFNMVSAMGIGKDAAFDMATGFTELALDASSFFDLPFDVAFQKIQAGLSGEAEPLKRLGILVTENAMKQLDWVQAIKAAGRELTEQEKVIARAQLIQQGLANAQGDLVRTQESWANATRLVAETWEDLREEIGKAVTENETLAVLISYVKDKIKELTSAVKENADEFQNFVSGGVKLAILAAEALAKSFGLMITGVGKVAQGLLALERTFGTLLPNYIENTDAIKEFADGMVDFGEAALAVGADIDLLQEELALAEKGLSKTRISAKDAEAGIEGVGSSADRAVIDIKALRSSFDDLGTSVDTSELSTSFVTIEEALLDIVPAVQDVRDEFEGWLKTTPTQMDELGRTLVNFVPQVNNYEGAVKEAAQETDNFNEILQQSANLTTIFGSSLGGLIGQLASAASGFQSLFGAGKGFSGFLEGFQIEDLDTGEMKTTFGSFLSGFASALPAIGALAGPMIKGFKALFGKIFKGPDIARDVARDLGPQISKGLEDAIKQSGQPVQLAIAEIFREGFASGTATADMLAREIGDLFSGFERGEFGETQLVSALESSIPMLIERLQELGPAGEAELQRIISAAQAMGVEFQGLSDLIAGTFAPDTLEEMMAAFDMTNAEVRELAELLGVDVQTNLERMAASVGLSTEEFQALAAAIKDKFGIELEDIGGLLESMGVTAEELATVLGVDVAKEAGALGTEIDESTESIKLSADAASRLADELERAARAASGISVSGISGVGSGGTDFSAQGGLHMTKPLTQPSATITMHRGEVAHIDKPERMPAQMRGGSSAANITVGPITIEVSGAGDPDKVVQHIKANLGQSLNEIFRAAKQKGHI